MDRSVLGRLAAIATAVVIVGATGAAPAVAQGPTHLGGFGRWLVVAKSSADYAGLKADVLAGGGRILREIPDIDTLVVAGGANVQALASDSHASGVAADRIVQIAPPEGGAASMHLPTGHGSSGGHVKVTPDPAFRRPGLMWNVNRVDAPRAWRATTGSPAVTVGVADTGLDYTHSELAGQVIHVEDFTGTESPPICSTYFQLPSPPFPSSSMGDADLATAFGGPATTDWNGHGSWIGGNIAAALDGVGVNGIAPSVKLVALKISQWCGAAYDSEILDAFTWAADNGIDVVSISFGGYTDITDPAQALVYRQYVKTVQYALRKGTLIVASAGNEHVRIGAGGVVLSHGSETVPGDRLVDYFGLYDTPGGIPGVVMVSSTNDIVAAPSATCPAGTTGDMPDAIGAVGSATCKPASDLHQPTGVGRQNQLAYYSNFGPRIDIAAPGGARKFNISRDDRGGTPGFPYTTADGTTAYEDFSITSDWAVEIPCFVGSSLGPQFYLGDCYSTIQGTSMATPHVSAVVALIASRYPFLRHQPLALAALLKATAKHVSGNTTQPLSATDTSPGDYTGVACASGYCHNGGTPIPDWEAYGAGLVDAASLGGFGR